MELLLNIIWLIVSAAPMVWWLRKHSVASGRREFCLAIGAMFCVGMLLFAPISISDDLHQDVFAAEDAKSAKKMVVSAVHAPATFSCEAHAFAAASGLAGNVQLSPTYLVPSFTPILSSSLFVTMVASRPPPAV